MANPNPNPNPSPNPNPNPNPPNPRSAAMFEGLTYLYTLAMARNKITELQTGVFRDLSELANLHLDSNRITTVQPGVFPVEGGITYDLGLVYRVMTNTTQRRLRIFSMRYNPSKCWYAPPPIFRRLNHIFCSMR